VPQPAVHHRYHRSAEDVLHPGLPVLGAGHHRGGRGRAVRGLSFCDARGLSAFVRIANHADAAGCRFGLIAPQLPVAKILRISGLDSRMPVFATIDDALAVLTATAST
jgi:hypothetical protein